MSIELLWIIPIVAASILVLVVALNLQEKADSAAGSNKERDLKREVDAFNQGLPTESRLFAGQSETRLRDIENTIQLVTTALSNQQKIIENFQGKDITLEKKLDELKEKLLELQHEYDITLSENYSLRARLKKTENGLESLPSHDLIDDTDTIERSQLAKMKIFSDTKRLTQLKYPQLDDTSEINLTEIH